MFISAGELNSILSQQDLIIVDCGYSPHEYRRAHIPFAIKRPGHPYVKSGTEEYPGLFYPENFAEIIEDMGISSDSLVVAYDSDGSLFAARFLWGLLLHGHRKVKLLNGGWQAWIANGNHVSVKINEPKERGSFKSKLCPSLVSSKDDLVIGETNIIDVRSSEEYYGLDSRGNKRAGRIPTAIHIEWTNFLTSSNTTEDIALIRPRGELEPLLQDLNNEKPIVTYCQGGVRASLVAYILHSFGFSCSIYDGSMKEWANNEELPLL